MYELQIPTGEEVKPEAENSLYFKIKNKIMTKFLCKKKFDRLVVFEFQEEPTYDPLLDYWNGKGKRILPFEEAKNYIYDVWFENSHYEINTQQL